MWKSRSRPACSFMSTKVGLLTTLVTPSPSATPFASSVLPAPSGPMRATSVPEWACEPSAWPIARVSWGASLRRRPGGFHGSKNTGAADQRPSGARVASMLASGTGARRPSSNRTSAIRVGIPDWAACRSSISPTSTPPRPWNGRRWAITRSPTRASARRDGQRSGVVHVEEPIGPEEARHAPGVGAEPAEELRIDPDLAEALHQQDPERAGHAARLAPASLDRLEVAQLLVEHPAEHDPGHAHRPRAGQRLGRGTRAADQDLAGRAGIDRGGAKLVARDSAPPPPAPRGPPRRCRPRRAGGRPAPRSPATPPRPHARGRGRGRSPSPRRRAGRAAASRRVRDAASTRPATGASTTPAPSTSASGCSASTRSPGRTTSSPSISAGCRCSGRVTGTRTGAIAPRRRPITSSGLISAPTRTLTTVPRGRWIRCSEASIMPPPRPAAGPRAGTCRATRRGPPAGRRSAAGGGAARRGRRGPRPPPRRSPTR